MLHEGAFGSSELLGCLVNLWLSTAPAPPPQQLPREFPGMPVGAGEQLRPGTDPPHPRQRKDLLPTGCGLPPSAARSSHARTSRGFWSCRQGLERNPRSGAAGTLRSAFAAPGPGGWCQRGGGRKAWTEAWHPRPPVRALAWESLWRTEVG